MNSLVWTWILKSGKQQGDLRQQCKNKATFRNNKPGKPPRRISIPAEWAATPAPYMTGKVTPFVRQRRPLRKSFRQPRRQKHLRQLFPTPGWVAQQQCNPRNHLDLHQRVDPWFCLSSKCNSEMLPSSSRELNESQTNGHWSIWLVWSKFEGSSNAREQKLTRILVLSIFDMILCCKSESS